MKFFRTSHALLVLMALCALALPGTVWLATLPLYDSAAPWSTSIIFGAMSLGLGALLIPVIGDYRATRREEAVARLHQTVITAVKSRLDDSEHQIVLRYGPDRLELDPFEDDSTALAWSTDPRLTILLDPDREDWSVAATLFRITEVEGRQRVFCGPATQLLYPDPETLDSTMFVTDTIPHHDRLPLADADTLTSLLEHLRHGEERWGEWKRDADGEWYHHQSEDS